MAVLRVSCQSPKSPLLAVLYRVPPVKLLGIFSSYYLPKGLDQTSQIENVKQQLYLITDNIQQTFRGTHLFIAYFSEDAINGMEK